MSYNAFMDGLGAKAKPMTTTEQLNQRRKADIGVAATEEGEIKFRITWGPNETCAVILTPKEARTLALDMLQRAEDIDG